MYYNQRFENINDGLPVLSDLVLTLGAETGSRNGACKELTHVGVSYWKPWQREILLDDRKANIAAQIAETMWVLAGRNDIEFLSHYLPRAADFSDDGETWRAGYGPRLRKWEGIDPEDNNHAVLTQATDQLAYVVKTLRDNPLSRQAVISLWDPAMDTTAEPVKDRACNNWITFSSRLGYLDMHVAVRSNDLIWGHTGVNYFEWSVLQEIVAGMLGVNVGSLHFSITSLHVYAPHWEKAQKIAGYRLSPVVARAEDSPRFDATGVDDVVALDYLIAEWFKVEERIRANPKDLLLHSMVENFPEPMMRSWLRVLRWWWSGNHGYLKPLAGTRLEYATHVSVQPPVRIQGNALNYPQKMVREETTACGCDPGATCGETPTMEKLKTIDNTTVGAHYTPTPSPFLQHVFRLHLDKHKAYGDSWKKRGESFSIIPNIARKIDRLGTGAETADETATDTAIDLLVYLAKYQDWLTCEDRDTDPHEANLKMLRVEVEGPTGAMSDAERVGALDNMFEMLLSYIENGERDRRSNLVDGMLTQAYELARHRWESVIPPVDAGGVVTDCCAESPFCDHDDYRADLGQ